MQRSKINLLLLAGCVMLLVGHSARGQEPERGPDLKGYAPVIHADLPRAEDVHEETHEFQRFWASADAWLAWIKNGQFPVLVTVGATSQPRPGAIGEDGTLLRFGGNVDSHERLGGRFQFGTWLDCNECLGVQVGGSFLASRVILFELASPGSPAIARPFFDVNAQQQDASLVTFPGLASGSIQVSSGTSFWGADATALLALNDSKDYPVRGLVGFRYLHLHDDLHINESVQVDPTSPVFPGQHISVGDLFDCNNYFYGPQIGLSGTYKVSRFEFQATGQCALGLTQECVGTEGFTHFDGPGGKTEPAGLLALGTNSGKHLRNAFAVVPEVDLDARFEVTRHIYLSAGWSFLYWSRVARAGNQVDTNINPDLVPTSATFGIPPGLRQPTPAVRDSDFWMHAAHVGVELRF